MTDIPSTMKAVVTTGVGGYENLTYQEVPIPEISESEYLVRITAAGINNTDINTRIGWYSSSVTGSTSDAINDKNDDVQEDGGWNGATPFPLIQGVDGCGIVVQAGSKCDQNLIGRRVIIRACSSNPLSPFDSTWLGVNRDGAFAQFLKIPATEAYSVNCDWSDAELASVPCAYGTAENMLNRARISDEDTVLITGASGGVGVATIQLAKRRGAKVLAVTSESKKEQVLALGADQVFERNDDLLALLGEMSVDVVIDNVVGEGFPLLIDLLKAGGRYITSGAIAGPITTLDMRKLYLKDLTMIGSTTWDEGNFENLISYIERGEIRPVVSQIFPLKEITTAQKLFMEKKHVGKIVLIPPS